jgi:hypothetical protein
VSSNGAAQPSEAKVNIEYFLSNPANRTNLYTFLFVSTPFLFLAACTMIQ